MGYTMDEKGWFAIVTTAIASGVGMTKIAEWWQVRRDTVATRQKTVDDKTIEDGATVRKEIWSRMTLLETRIDLLEKEIEVWRGKYFEMQGRYMDLLSEHKVVVKEATDLRVYCTKLQSLAKLKNLDSYIELQHLIGEMGVQVGDEPASPS